MLEALGKGTVLGYCGNVHPVRTFDDLIATIRGPAKRVRDLVGADIGYGLWMPADVLEQVTDDDTKRLRDAMGESGLVPYTFNAFPYGDFHGEVVKKRVYEPAWDDPQRADFTLSAATLLSGIVPEGELCTISTLPIGWRNTYSDERRARSVAALRELSERLSQLGEDTGRQCIVALEPEPGCVLDSGWDVGFLLEEFGEWPAHLGICHDVCHAAVMAEPQPRMLNACQTMGIPTAKIQISSAPIVTPDLWEASAAEVRNILEPLRTSRYLHQTYIREQDPIAAYEDIGEALDSGKTGAWRVHYHVPISDERFGPLPTTRDQIEAAIRIGREVGCRHFEIETYTWPDNPDTADGIANEFAALPALIARPNRIGMITRLFRVSNIPTVWTNVFVGSVLGGSEGYGLAASLAGATALYFAGMALNDVWDSRSDTWERPARPIPRGEIGAVSAGMTGILLLAGGVGVLAAAGAGAFGLLLAICVIAYTVTHGMRAWPALLMALCRALLYPMAAASGQGDWSRPEVFIASGIAAVHALGITLLARSETKKAGIRLRIPLLIAGFCLIDAAILSVSDPGWGIVACVGGFALAVMLQRHVPAT